MPTFRIHKSLIITNGSLSRVLFPYTKILRNHWISYNAASCSYTEKALPLRSLWNCPEISDKFPKNFYSLGDEAFLTAAAP